MQKKNVVLLFFVIAVMIVCAVPVRATTDGVIIESMPLGEALEDPEIVSLLEEDNMMDEIEKAQAEIRASMYIATAMYANEQLDEDTITDIMVKEVTEEFELSLPDETSAGIINNGEIVIKRDAQMKAIDVWYLYYPLTDNGISVRIAGLNTGTVLESVSGSLTRYYLNDTTWTKHTIKNFSVSSVSKNGVLYTWNVAKWGVKEKFEYNSTVMENGTVKKFDNINENNITRYNFEAKPYNSFDANGGHRHHFVPATSLSQNGFDTQTAYCIRMMTADHRETASYGNAAYVSSISSMMRAGEYMDVLQTEVNSLKVAPDTEGIYNNLQEKYYDEVVICLLQYKALFGLD